MEKFKEYYFKNKTYGVWKGAYARCNNAKNKGYSRYGGRGIKFLLTLEEIRRLWIRDNAFEMKKPSIDRINNNGDYIFNNCRFIENLENTLRAVRKPINQYDLNYNFIKKFNSIKEASDETGIDYVDIRKCCNYDPKVNSAGYYYWHYVKEDENV